ncbi:methionine--tRNA ligase subunit beta [Patescibacteria group bacterium]|nr:methionine--tRNA ligase subunit beta [Patescibacteria group bacterium]MCL5410126.1 methionine--tRNA ligase subunit beta [Patescibacteria group bacterium]
MISIDDIAKIELKVGTILAAEALAGSDKLIKLQVDLGEEQPRQILAGIKKWYKAENLIGKQIVVVANLEPRMMMGYESQGMILAADSKKPVILKPQSKVEPGARIR